MYTGCNRDDIDSRVFGDQSVRVKVPGQDAVVLGAGDQQLGLFVHVYALDGFSVSLERLYPGIAHGVPELRVSVLRHDHHVLRGRRRGYVTDRYAAADACNNERTRTRSEPKSATGPAVSFWPVNAGRITFYVQRQRRL